MPILPNKSALYAAALRKTVFSRLLKKGKSGKIYKNLFLISLFEAVALPKDTIPTDLFFFANGIIGACLVKRILKCEFFRAEISTYGSFLINRKPMGILLALLCLKCSRISVTHNGDITITADNIMPEKHVKAVIKCQGGKMFFERKTKRVLILIPAEKTEKVGSGVPTLKEYLLDDFSVVNTAFKANYNG